MFRNFLESLGDFFKNKFIDLVMGLLAGILILPQANSLAEISQLDLRFIVAYLIVVALAAGFFQILGTALIWLSEWLPANIEVSSSVPEFEWEYVPDTRDPSLISMYAVLSVTNNEHSELTDCYGVLKEVKLGYTDIEVFMGNKRMRLLKWIENQPEKTTIGAYGGTAQLTVFGKTVKYDDERNRHLVFANFCIYEGQAGILAMEEIDVYEVRIDVHAKLNGKSVRAEPFHGFVTVENGENYTGLIKIARGRPPSKEVLYELYRASVKEARDFWKKANRIS